MAWTILTATILATQATAPPPPPAQLPPAAAHPDAQPDDIIVEGYRERADIATKVVAPGDTSGRLSRTKYEYSERIAKCAARSRLSSLDRLRAVVDGVVNTADHHVAQDRLVRINITCSEGTALLGFSSPPRAMAEVRLNDFVDVPVGGQTDQPIAGLAAANPFPGIGSLPDAAPLGWSIYDRGAFTIQALKFFAPDLKLTREQTGDQRVQSRFNLREMPRNRFRLPVDFHYFEVAVCMVRVEPRLAVRLAMSDGSARISDVQAALVDRARVCVGGAKNVRIDPTQFRLYIADAVYRWAVAAQGVDTLIPDKVASEVSRRGGSSPS